ncbi:hypothetical protein OG2516_09458 [Oceanicola granulosus HTCC2516]|uniref:Uncharacterized protein n=1 Tax=Oceanicola granulosus (strain ATCC BAA-861 / DSM 15982 / KCTC 12143 / HTCC2516) TaxID=314256 RepID=Q2CDN5_OCEGH|nr:hypothetical protein [Oceanicola granulosus]EAR50815.1 hypothetical protein OG2516_09458 [Oceanicola granulosus HTCC2516]
MGSKVSVVLRIAPWLVGVVALGVVAVGAWLQAEANDARAEMAELYLAGPPAAVPVSAFHPSNDLGPLSEVVLTAQLDVAGARLLEPDDEAGAPALMVPLYGEEATLSDLNAPFGIALFTGPGFSAERFTAERFEALARARGPIGPVVTLNGRYGAVGAWAETLAGAEVPAAMLRRVVYPFVEGRRAAYLPASGESTIFGLCARIAGGLGFLALALAALAAQSGARAQAAARPPLAEAEVPVPEAQVRRSPVRGALIAFFALVVAAGAGMHLLPMLTPGIAAWDIRALDTVRAGLGTLATWGETRLTEALAGDLAALAVLGCAALSVLLVTMRLAGLRRRDDDEATS